MLYRLLYRHKQTHTHTRTGKISMLPPVMVASAKDMEARYISAIELLRYPGTFRIQESSHQYTNG